MNLQQKKKNKKAKNMGKLHTQTGTKTPFIASAENTTDKYHPPKFCF